MQLINENKDLIKSILQKNNLDGWLLYSFQGSNKIAEEISGIAFATRRWFLFIDKKGNVRLLAHELEKTWFDELDVELITYTNSSNIIAQLKNLLGKSKKVVMEYSPKCEIPYISKVDAGTVELIQHLDVEVHSSAEFVQHVNSRWGGKPGLDSHKKASAVLELAFQKGCQKIRQDIKTRGYSNEYEVQQLVMQIIEENDCETDHPVVVAVQPNNASPHYFPTAKVNSKITENQLVLFDMWCKQKAPNAIYSDITLMAFTGKKVPEKIAQVWQAVSGARDAAVQFIKNRIKAGQKVQGFEIDQISREYISVAGFGEFFIHRTGHSIQKEVHARGVNIDSYELKDTRILIPDCGFSIEPGIYLPDQFGIRSEIDVYIDLKGDPKVFTPIQKNIELI